uniref:Putative secreted protein n=1 Tax=Ixodes ricinus TaxID=34613 RepID=A0A6B0U8G0_IXORI
MERVRSARACLALASAAVDDTRGRVGGGVGLSRPSFGVRHWVAREPATALSEEVEEEKVVRSRPLTSGSSSRELDADSLGRSG